MKGQHRRSICSCQQCIQQNAGHRQGTELLHLAPLQTVLTTVAAVPAGCSLQVMGGYLGLPCSVAFPHESCTDKPDSSHSQIHRSVASSVAQKPPFVVADDPGPWEVRWHRTAGIAGKRLNNVQQMETSKNCVRSQYRAATTQRRPPINKTPWHRSSAHSTAHHQVYSMRDTPAVTNDGGLNRACTLSVLLGSPQESNSSVCAIEFSEAYCHVFIHVDSSSRPACSPRRRSRQSAYCIMEFARPSGWHLCPVWSHSIP